MTTKKTTVTNHTRIAEKLLEEREKEQEQQKKEEAKEEKQAKKKAKQSKKAPAKKKETRCPSKTPEGQKRYKAQRGFLKALQMGFSGANHVLQGADEALLAIPEDERPIDSFCFSDYEAKEGSKAIIDFLDEYYPDFIENAPASLSLILWTLGVSVPRVLAIAAIKQHNRKMESKKIEESGAS